MITVTFQLNSPNGCFNVTDKASLQIKQMNSRASGSGMVLRGSWEVNLDNGKLLTDQSSQQPAIQMTGEEHQVKVGNGGELVMRTKNNRGGWELSLVQESPWMSEDGKELKGAQLTFRNAELIDSSGTI